jgi:hypothetical protein
MNNPTLDAGIPVLTEIIPVPQAGDAAQVKPPEPAPAVEIIEDAAALEAQAVADWDEEKWSRMESEIRARILQQVLQRVDFVLEQRVRDSLADVLQTAVEGLAAEIRGGLHNTIKDVISRAVSQEITKLQSSKK